MDTTSRRRFLSGVGAGLLLAHRAEAALSLTTLRHAPWRVEPSAKELKLERNWSGEFCKPKLVNTGNAPMGVKEVVLFSVPLDLPPDTHHYGESFQMLSQTAGTLGHPVDLGYSEPKHYKIPQPEGVTAASGLLTLGSSTLAFTSCHRFIGRFFLGERTLEVVVDTEDLELAPGQSWDLEEFTPGNSPASVAASINRNHPPRGLFPAPPTGWCSWYCFGPRVTSQQVLDNLDKIAKDIPSLKYVQIDDGYQPAMGDWLETGKAFGGDVLGVLKEIRRRGFEPAIWVAPFIAEADSHLFQQHPDWFMKHADGTPLPAAEVTFGGRRRGPWYALDGTHPDAQKHLENLFHTMRHEWGCTYFKLDANFWGAMHGGHFHDGKATRIEGYRRGIRRQLHSGLQPSDLAIVWIDRWLAQLGRHQTHLAGLPNCHPPEPEPQLAERPAVVERSGCRSADRQSSRRGVPLPRDRCLRHRRNDAVRRRSHQDSARSVGDVEKAAAAHWRRRRV